MADQRPKVLVADDVSAMRDQIQTLLIEAGYKDVSTSSNGKAALEIIDKKKYNLIITDWHWPSENEGLDILKHIRDNPDLYHIAVVMVTAEDTREQVIQAIAAGIDDYLIKPVTADQLNKRIEGVLQKKASTSGSRA